jgi:hypothetical protein
MNWTAIQAALVSWAASATGLSVSWAHQNKPRGAYPLATLSIVAEAQPGPDHVTYELDELTGKLVPKVSGLRHLTVSLRVETLMGATYNPATTARHYTSLARASLRKQAALDALQAAEIAVIRALNVQEVPTFADDGTASVAAVLDVQFATVENIADSVTDYINTVEAEGGFPPSEVTIEGPFGAEPPAP